ncbi:MAG: DUF1028 domain-containing protein [Nitrosomonadaceae bacterium]
MTFSIAAFDPENGDLGIAVQSKFPNVGVVIPFARAGIGAIATQSYCNTSFGPRGLTLLQKGASPQDVVDELIAGDEDHEYRQLAVIDAQGHGAAYTGAQCFDWCGSVVGDNFSVQGNCLGSDAVANHMAQSMRDSRGSLAERLLDALSAGQAAGGDRRGQQSAALLVVRECGGYGGHDDRYVDISVYDHSAPIEELYRLYSIHRLTYFRSDPDKLVPAEGEIARELQEIMKMRSFYSGEVDGLFNKVTRNALHDFMGWENYDERIRNDELVDLEVLEDIRKKHQQWLRENKSS